MDHLAAADIKGNVIDVSFAVCIEHQVAGLQLGLADLCTLLSLGRGMMAQLYAKFLEY